MMNLETLKPRNLGTFCKSFLLLILLLLPTTSFAFRFGVLGDSRNGENIHQSLLKIAKQWKVDMVFNTGDIITHPGNKEEWKDFWQVIGKQPFPYYFAAGNHDIDSKATEQMWKDEVKLPGNELYYKVVKDNVLFVVLNTYLTGQHKKIDGVQWEWLKKTLNSKKYKYKFVFYHHPAFLAPGMAYYGNSLDIYPKLRNRLHNLFVKKKVTAVFEGHEHTYRRTVKDGVNYIITGGGGARLYSGFCHIVIVDIKSDDQATVKVIDWHGVTRREFFLR